MTFVTKIIIFQGPMVYGITYCPESRSEELRKLGCADSKTLNEEQRENLFEKLDSLKDFAGWAVEIIAPNAICNNMFKRQKYSLNEVSYDSAIGLIKHALSLNVNVTSVYVDTVGSPEKYQAKLSAIFPGIKITVAKKADATYPVVSAASICAKVTRDEVLKNWQFREPSFQALTSTKTENAEKLVWGSGYPAGSF
jgi:ribonuclease H2 subunit A